MPTLRRASFEHALHTLFHSNYKRNPIASADALPAYPACGVKSPVPNVRQSGTSLPYRLSWRTRHLQARLAYRLFVSPMNRVIEA